jgi:hypothetical protein
MLNEALSEVIDLVQDVKQARRVVPVNHGLHDQLDQLFDDLRGWAALLFDEDERLGTPALGSIPSVAGRTLPILWPSGGTDEQVLEALLEQLDRLARHLSRALEEQEADSTRAVLSEIQQALTARVRVLGG